MIRDRMPWIEQLYRKFVGVLDERNGYLKTGEMSPFGEQITAEYTPLIELDSSNGLSLVRRDSTSTTGTGSVTNTGGEFVLSTGATASSTAEIKTKERGRYQPGITGLAGTGVRWDALPTGEQDAQAGYFDDTDGVWIGHDATGIYLQYRHGGTTEDKVYQSAWNGPDKLDGNGPSGVTLNPLNGMVVRFSMVWYFAGPLIVHIQTMTDNGVPVYAEVHYFAGARTSALFSNPKLPVNAAVQNGATASDLTVYIGGRQFAVIGRYDPNRRGTPEYRTGVSVASGATEPLVSFRKKSARIHASKSVKVLSATVLSDEKGLLKLYLAPTLTGASFGDLQEVDPSETALESDISATAISGGTLMRSTTITGGQGSSIAGGGLKELGQDLPDDTIVTLAFENLSGQTSEVDAVIEAEEEW